MTISLKCPIGHQLEAHPALHGRALPCPECGNWVSIPEPLTNPTDNADTTSLSWGRRLLSMCGRIGHSVASSTIRILRVLLLLFAILAILWAIFLRPSTMNHAEKRLNEIGLAFYSFESDHKVFAFERLQDQKVQQLGQRRQLTELSWRVHLLPYLGHENLYKQFHLDEPWDSPHNLSLMNLMPDVYRLGSSVSKTRFRVLTGPGMLFGQTTPQRSRELKDGLRSTLLAVFVGRDQETPWTRPDDVMLNPQSPLSCLGSVSGTHIAAVTANGKPVLLPIDIDPADFLALATPNGGEIIDADMYRRQTAESFWNWFPAVFQSIYNFE